MIRPSRPPKTPAQEQDNFALLHAEMVEIIRTSTDLHAQFGTAAVSKYATAIVRGQCRRYGTQRVYYPRLYVDDAGRNAAIRNEFHGTNMGELCKKYNLSPSRIYTICRRASAPQAA